MTNKNFSTIIPVLMAGGSGTRLWPLSRKSYPKQFAALIDDISLFQTTAKRLTTSENIRFEAPITVTNSNFRFIVGQQLKNVAIDPGPILIEPESKNTAPAILAACLSAISKDPEAVLLVAPCDHIIPQVAAFHNAVEIGLEQVKLGKIVTFGITPTRVETGYGYLELNVPSKSKILDLKGFIEKPDYHIAKKMIDDGCCLWNAGIFLFKASDMIAAFKLYFPNLIKPVAASLDHGHADLGFFRLEARAWSQCDDISIDYAVMERATNLSVVRYSAGWSDLGDWASVWQELVPDATGVLKTENTTAIDCSNTLLRSENSSQHLVGLGLDNIIAVAMPDAVLVANMSKAQDVKQVVARLKIDNINQAEVFPKDYRPWGWFEPLVKNDGFQVKRIWVNPGASLSLQSHLHRSEHWIVVKGTATVTVGLEVKIITEGESVYIPLGTVHRMQNFCRDPLVVIEIQTGTYLGEDDIIRYEDQYARKVTDART